MREKKYHGLKIDGFAFRSKKKVCHLLSIGRCSIQFPRWHRNAISIKKIDFTISSEARIIISQIDPKWMRDEIGNGKGKNYRINNCLVFDKRFLPGDPSCVRRTGSFRSELQSRSQLRCLRRWRCVAPAERRTARVMPAHRGGRRAAVAGRAAAPPLLVHAACKIHSIGACCCRPMQVPAAWVLVLHPAARLCRWWLEPSHTAAWLISLPHSAPW